MKRVLGVLLAAFIGVGAFVGIANAQATGPDTQACKDAKAIVVDLEVELGTAIFNERKAEEEALANAKSVNLTALQNEIDGKQRELNALLAVPNTPQSEVVEKQRQLDVAKADLASALKAIADADKALKSEGSVTAGVRARLALAVQKQDVACKAPVVTTPPTTTTVAPPPPTTTTTVPPPPPAFVDLDCIDFPLNGRTAQDVLDETPGEDPHNLDANGNRIACEVVADDNNNDNPPPPQQVIQVPVGGVATGDGSSL